VAPPQAANPMLAMLLADPMFAMQFAVDQSRRGALEELAQLASDQQATNARLAELRKLKTAVKQALSDDRIDSAELDMVGSEFVNLASAASEHGLTSPAPG
jgi:GAF domain-containing protein